MIIKRKDSIHCMISIGDGIPYFELGGVDDEIYTPESFTGRVLVMIFTCNHCPYAQAYEDRLIRLQKYFSVQGVDFVAINSNDDSSYPEDSFLKMKERAKKKGFPYPYLRDKDQVIAQKFGAEVTPEAFVFDRNNTLQYHGRIDDNWRNPEGVEDNTLKNAISDLLSGATPKVQKAPTLGCSIKWK